MKKSVIILFLFCFSAPLFGCAKMAKMMAPAGSHMVGVNANQLIASWGVPNRSFNANGVTYLEYVQSFYASGWHNHCTTTFAVQNNVVVNYKATGNNCRYAGNFVQAAPVYINGQQPYADPLTDPNSLLNMF